MAVASLYQESDDSLGGIIERVNDWKIIASGKQMLVMIKEYKIQGV